jgi:hypothetical protein
MVYCIALLFRKMDVVRTGQVFYESSWWRFVDQRHLLVLLFSQRISVSGRMTALFAVVFLETKCRDIIKHNLVY